MSEHLPECPRSKPCAESPPHDHTWRDDCVITCICPALRACTVRVQLAAQRVGFKAGVRGAKGVVQGEMYRWGIAPTDPPAESIIAAIDRLAQEAP